MPTSELLTLPQTSPRDFAWFEMIDAKGLGIRLGSSIHISSLDNGVYAGSEM